MKVTPLLFRLAAVLLCTEGDRERCGACRSCRLFDTGNHPDYHEVGVPEGRQELPIKLIRELRRKASVKPVLAPGRVFVIRQAERMNIEAANCFLKTLEEPPGDSCFVLIAAGLWDLPQTIVSRCELVKFSGLPLEQVEEMLRGEGMDQEDAWWLARRSWGSPGLAVRLREAGLDSFNSELADRLFELAPDDVCALTDWLSQQASRGSGSRPEARVMLQELLECMAVFYRDLAAAALAPGRVELFNKAFQERLEQFAQRQSLDSILDCADRVFQAIERIGTNANSKVALDDLFAGLAAKHALNQ